METVEEAACVRWVCGWCGIAEFGDRAPRVAGGETYHPGLCADEVAQARFDEQIDAMAKEVGR